MIHKKAARKWIERRKTKKYPPSKRKQARLFRDQKDGNATPA